MLLGADRAAREHALYERLARGVLLARIIVDLISPVRLLGDILSDFRREPVDLYAVIFRAKHLRAAPPPIDLRAVCFWRPVDFPLIDLRAVSGLRRGPRSVHFMTDQVNIKLNHHRKNQNRSAMVRK